MQHGKCEKSFPQLPLNNQVDATAALRAELKQELKNKKQCTYQPYECTQLSIDGFKYCSKHILQDKNAPFKQCSYMFNSNGKRCHLPAPRGDRKDYGYCSEHALKATLARNKYGAKYPPPRSAEALLQSLSHYVKKPRIRSSSSSTQHSDEGDRITPDEGDLKATKFQDPFVDLDPCSIFSDRCNQVLDFCSESESDMEASTFSSVWHDAQADSSGDESIDSEQEDVLKHANVYTAEEITLMTRDKLVRLQSLYIEQYRHLQYLLKERRRKYLHSLRREKETCCNIYSQVRDNPKEQRLYKKLKALNNYQKCHGIDAILNKRLNDLRVKVSEGINARGQIFSKCSFSEGGVKCTERSLPLSKYCQRHILEDTNQVLFRACGKLTGDITCPTPIAAVFDESTCPLHLDIPLLRSYSILRKDSESDIDETSDAHLNYSHLSDNVKTEFMHYDIPPELPKMETLPSMLFEENTRGTDESSSDFAFKSCIEESAETKAEHSDESMEGINSEHVPECVHEEVEISTEVNDSERSLADVSGSDIKTETVDVSDMVVVDDGLEVEMETTIAEESGIDTNVARSLFDESQTTDTDMSIAAETDMSIVAETDMSIVAETDTSIVAETDTSIVAETDTSIVAETDTSIVAETDMSIAAESSPMGLPDAVVEVECSAGVAEPEMIQNVTEDECLAVVSETEMIETVTAEVTEEAEMTKSAVEMVNSEIQRVNAENDPNATQEIIENEPVEAQNDTETVDNVEMKDTVLHNENSIDRFVQESEMILAGTDEAEIDRVEMDRGELGESSENVHSENTMDAGLENDEKQLRSSENAGSETETVFKEDTGETTAVLQEDETEKTPALLQEEAEGTPAVLQEQAEETSTIIREEEAENISSVVQEEETEETPIVPQEEITEATSLNDA